MYIFPDELTLLSNLWTRLSSLGRWIGGGWCLFGEIRLLAWIGCSAGGIGRCSIGTSCSYFIAVIRWSTISRWVIAICTGAVSVYFLLTTIRSQYSGLYNTTTRQAVINKIAIIHNRRWRPVHERWLLLLLIHHVIEWRVRLVICCRSV